MYVPIESFGLRAELSFLYDIFLSVVHSGELLPCLQINSLVNVDPRFCDFILTPPCNACSFFRCTYIPVFQTSKVPQGDLEKKQKSWWRLMTALYTIHRDVIPHIPRAVAQNMERSEDRAARNSSLLFCTQQRF